MSKKRRLPDAPSLMGHYAGFASRFVAYVIDAALIPLLFALGSSAVTWLVKFVFGHEFSEDGSWVWAVAFGLWSFSYFWYCWAVAGRTPGMALLGVRVVRSDGAELGWGRAFVRTLVFPLSFAFFGLGFLGVLFGRDHKAWHDHAANSVVVYNWDARAARLRLLARSSA